VTAEPPLLDDVPRERLVRAICFLRGCYAHVHTHVAVGTDCIHISNLVVLLPPANILKNPNPPAGDEFVEAVAADGVAAVVDIATAE
jgi:hypothetical protein